MKRPGAHAPCLIVEGSECALGTWCKLLYLVYAGCPSPQEAENTKEPPETRSPRFPRLSLRAAVGPSEESPTGPGRAQEIPRQAKHLPCHQGGPTLPARPRPACHVLPQACLQDPPLRGRGTATTSPASWRLLAGLHPRPQGAGPHARRRATGLQPPARARPEPPSAPRGMDPGPLARTSGLRLGALRAGCRPPLRGGPRHTRAPPAAPLLLAPRVFPPMPKPPRRESKFARKRRLRELAAKMRKSRREIAAQRHLALAQSQAAQEAAESQAHQAAPPRQPGAPVTTRGTRQRAANTPQQQHPACDALPHQSDEPWWFEVCRDCEL